MAKFILKFTLFLIPIISLLLFIELKLSKRQSVYHIQKYQLEKNISKIDILILGNSHAFEGINPQQLSENAFNLAGSGQDFTIDLLLLKKYIHKLANLNYVIIPISYHSFFYKIEDSPIDKNRIGFYKKVYGINLCNNNNISNLFWIPQYGLKESFYYTFEKSNNENFLMTNGHIQYSINSNDYLAVTNQKKANKNLNVYHKLMNVELFDYNYIKLVSIIELLKNKNITPVLVSIPTYKTYYNNLQPLYKEMMTNGISKLCSQYNLSYLNFLDSPNYKATDFRNSNHLNSRGAIKFSKELHFDLKKL